ncbi:MAG: hypothetical protein LAE24_08520 [Candidatus Contendobacter sp.]|nr:hypothetical protein [Candidatus Contendobacter sp.]
MRKMLLSTISLLVACGTVYAAGSPETPATTPTATTPAATAPVTAAAVVTTASLSGKWSSNLVGDVTIEQTGNKIMGTYHHTDDDNVTQDGKLEGVIEGKTIKAKWWERPKVGKGEESRGDLEWKMADDGKTLIGWYRDEGDKDKTDWNLER